MRKFKLKTLYCIILILCIFPVSCGRYQTSVQDIPENALKVYRTDNAMSSLYAEYYVPVETEQMSLVREMINASYEASEFSAYKPVLPEEVKILNMYLGEAQQLVLDFSSEYAQMSKVQEIICRAAIVKTLSQIEGIDYFEFYVNGNPLMLSNDQPAGIMKSADFIDNTGDNTQFTQSVALTIYLTDEEGKTLKESSLIVESDGSRSMEEMVINQLIYGPLAVQTNLRPVLPEGTRLNKVSIKDGICYVDFSTEFLNKIEGISRDVALYSIVNSLCELTSVVMVQFTVDGEPIKNFDGEDLFGFYDRKLELIESEMTGVTSK